MEDLDRQRLEAIRGYSDLWIRITSEWNYGQSDKLWLTYSANYLLNTAGVKWAIDPYSLFTRVGGGEQPDFLKDLKNLQLVVLTHNHSDHLDLNLIAALSELPIRWVIPEFMLEKVRTVVNLSNENIIIPEILKPIFIDNLTLTPFEGLHIHGSNGVPSMGYLAEFSKRRWLFPGDTRTYDFSRLPEFGELTGVVGHLWLGKAEALDQNPSKLDEFCQFYSRFRTQNLIITHLREFGRIAEEFWDIHNFETVKDEIHRLSPELDIISALMGDRVNLSPQC